MAKILTNKKMEQLGVRPDLFQRYQVKLPRIFFRQKTYDNVISKNQQLKKYYESDVCKEKRLGHIQTALDMVVRVDEDVKWEGIHKLSYLNLERLYRANNELILAQRIIESGPVNCAFEPLEQAIGEMRSLLEKKELPARVEKRNFEINPELTKILSLLDIVYNYVVQPRDGLEMMLRPRPPDDSMPKD